MVELPDDAIEALVQAAEHAYEYTPYDEMAEHAWPNVVRAVYPLIAARVRAEALREAAEKIAPNQVRPSNVIVVGARMTDDVLDMVRTVEDALVAAVRAEAVAAERQRIKATVWTQRGLLADREHTLAVVNRIIDAAGSVPVATPQRPEIVVLCGSTRFKDAFRGAAKAEALAGRIVLTVSDLDPRPEARHVNVPIDAETKALLDDLHKRKIDLAERVLVLNVGGYIGESTRSEIEYATALGKPINYLETDPCRCPDCAASPVLVGHPEPWFRETPESLALLEAERAEVAAVEARAGRPPGDRETFDRRAGQAWQCDECAAWWLRTSDWPSDQRIRWWTTPILWLRLRRSVPTGQPEER